MVCVDEILAGMPVRVTAVIEPFPDHGGDLSTTTALACVTDAAGDSEPLATVVTNDGDLSVTVVTEWEIPDGQDAGKYVITIDTDGALIAAIEVPIKVRRRREALVPAP